MKLKAVLAQLIKIIINKIKTAEKHEINESDRLISSSISIRLVGYTISKIKIYKPVLQLQYKTSQDLSLKYKCLKPSQSRL